MTSREDAQKIIGRMWWFCENRCIYFHDCRMYNRMERSAVAALRRQRCSECIEQQRKAWEEEE